MSVLKLATPGGTKLDSTLETIERPKKITLQEGFLPASESKLLQPLKTEKIPDPAKVMAAAPSKILVVGLCGVSCGGKTTMAKELQNWLGDKFGDIIMQDDYYRPVAELPINPITNFYEFDEPEAVKMNDIITDIKKWKEENENTENEDSRVLVVEGTMIFTNLEIAELCDLRYIIHVDFKTAEYRRSLRNYPIPDPPLVMAINIWPKYIKHRAVTVKLAKENNFVFKQIDGTVNVRHTLAGIIQDLRVNKHN